MLDDVVLVCLTIFDEKVAISRGAANRHARELELPALTRDGTSGAFLKACRETELVYFTGAGQQWGLRPQERSSRGRTMVEIVRDDGLKVAEMTWHGPQRNIRGLVPGSQQVTFTIRRQMDSANTAAAEHYCQKVIESFEQSTEPLSWSTLRRLVKLAFDHLQFVPVAGRKSMFFTYLDELEKLKLIEALLSGCLPEDGFQLWSVRLHPEADPQPLLDGADVHVSSLVARTLKLMETWMLTPKDKRRARQQVLAEWDTEIRVLQGLQTKHEYHLKGALPESRTRLREAWEMLEAVAPASLQTVTGE